MAGLGHRVDREHRTPARAQDGDHQPARGFDRDRDRVGGAVASLGEHPGQRGEPMLDWTRRGAARLDVEREVVYLAQQSTLTTRSSPLTTLTGNWLAERDVVMRFFLELADHDQDGDVDWAIHLLNEREHPQYGAIIARLREAGRDDEVLNWIDRAVAEGRISGQGGGNDYWLSPSAVAATYRGLGRIEDAIGVLGTDFVGRPTVDAYRSLLDFAVTIDRTDTERTWALDHARELARGAGSGAVLIQLALSAGDVDVAWEAADRYGPGWAWQELATQGAETRPVAAADLYRPQLENDLRRPNTRLYPGIAATLATMAERYERGGRSADFELYVAKVRQDYGRRPSLMKALQAKGL